eukprot:s6732_g3.t1
MGAGSSVSAEKYKGTDLPEATVVTVKPRSLDPVVSDEGNVANDKAPAVAWNQETSSQRGEAEEEIMTCHR